MKKDTLFLKLFIILKLLINTSQRHLMIEDLSVICCIDNLKEVIKVPLDLCTAIATYSTNDDANIMDIAPIRGDLPFVYVIDHYSGRNMKKKIKPHHIDDFLKEISKTIMEYNISVVIYDKLYKNKKLDQIDEKLNNRIKNLIDKSREQHPDVLFGLTLTKREEILVNAFNASLLNSVVDIYLAKTYFYRKCEWSDQFLMVNNTTHEDMKGTLKGIQNFNYNMSKIIPVIRVIVNSVMQTYAHSYGAMSYSKCCSANFHRQRKFCIDNLDSFYKKGELCRYFKLPGLFIQSLDRDDLLDKCSCGYHPVLQVIRAGMLNHSVDTLISCPTFGVISQYQNKVKPITLNVSNISLHRRRRKLI